MGRMNKPNCDWFIIVFNVPIVWVFKLVGKPQNRRGVFSQVGHVLYCVGQHWSNSKIVSILVEGLDHLEAIELRPPLVITTWAHYNSPCGTPAHVICWQVPCLYMGSKHNLLV